jgi:putative FmdB family regulatory protein
MLRPVPTYEYRCTNGHLTEIMQRMSDPPLAECPVCGAVVQKVLHPVAIHYKGSGFYSTDYGKGKPAKTDGAGSGDSAGAAAKGDGKSGGDSGTSTSTSTSSSSSGSSSSSSGGSSSGGSTSSSSGGGSKSD